MFKGRIAVQGPTLGRIPPVTPRRTGVPGGDRCPRWGADNDILRTHARTPTHETTTTHSTKDTHTQTHINAHATDIYALPHIRTYMIARTHIDTHIHKQVTSPPPSPPPSSSSSPPSAPYTQHTDTRKHDDAEFGKLQCKARSSKAHMQMP